MGKKGFVWFVGTNFDVLGAYRSREVAQATAEDFVDCDPGQEYVVYSEPVSALRNGLTPEAFIAQCEGLV